MIPSWCIYIALVCSAYGIGKYCWETWHDRTSPNRVTWTLWAIEGILAFVIEKQQHIGATALMTLALGLGPVFVVAVSFKNPHSAWKLDAFDVLCGVVSLAGLIFWCFINEPTVALVSFVAADQMAALPTLRKSWVDPSRETASSFAMGAINCGISVLTLKTFTTAGFLFPGVILICDTIITLTIVTKVGPRYRASKVLHHSKVS